MTFRDLSGCSEYAVAMCRERTMDGFDRPVHFLSDAFLIETTFIPTLATFHLRVTERGTCTDRKRTQNTHLKRVLSTPKQEMHEKCKYKNSALHG